MALSCFVVSDAGASVPPLAADRAAQVMASLANATKTTPPGLSAGLVGLRPPEERAKSMHWYEPPLYLIAWVSSSAVTPALEPSGRAMVAQPALGLIV